ncbi:MAG: hypothetical protein AAF357_08465, partial [Verrucomicrobiota bacterium]
MTPRFAITPTLLTLLMLSSCRTINEDLPDPAKMTQATFAIADTNSDGKLSLAELATFQHREALAEFDLDNDENISIAEWAAARPSAGEEDPHFKALDKDGDGQISEKEAVAFITGNSGFGKQFRKLD